MLALKKVRSIVVYYPMKKVGFVLCLLVMVPFSVWKVFETQYYLRFMPTAFGKVSLTKQTTMTAEFGPSGHDAILAFFDLPETTAQQIAEGGVSFLNRVDSENENRRAQRFGEWKATPWDSSHDLWVSKKSCDPENSDWWIASHAGHSCPGIAAYLRGYGFLEQVSVEDTHFVDEILFNTGGFVSKRRVGYLIISPERRVIVFAHSG